MSYNIQQGLIVALQQILSNPANHQDVLLFSAYQAAIYNKSDLVCHFTALTASGSSSSINSTAQSSCSEDGLFQSSHMLMQIMAYFREDTTSLLRFYPVSFVNVV